MQTEPSAGTSREAVDRLTGTIVDAAMRVHRTLGPGLLESVYQAALAYELRGRGLKVRSEVAVPVEYEQVRLDVGFRVDLMIEDVVILELKSVEVVLPVHKKALLTYLRLSGKRVGLLINFGAELLKLGITRVVNDLPE